MRSRTVIQQAMFSKHPESGKWEVVSLPHTWNALDGQDGGADYDRGAYSYCLALPEPAEGMRQYLQFEGANHIASVYAGDTLLCTHEGGFSTFRVDVTEPMARGCRTIRVVVDNRSSHVYPQQADFTFFGGLYRDVSFLQVSQCHFDLMRHGSDGVFVTPKADGRVRLDVFTTAAEGAEVTCAILDPKGNNVLTCSAPAQEHTVLEGKVESPLLWDGLEAPNCYTAAVALSREGQELDRVEVLFGFRSFSVDPDKGFFLNGRSYPLHGVARHQDRLNKGWAISHADHEEDLAIIREMGVNSIRLAHYQHDQYFYTLCDKAGMVLWAEIPFISMFMEGDKARENTVSQMTELVVQNYNHPAICFWGISNEITIGGETEPLLENLKELNDLVHKLDPSRLTTMAQVSMLPMESPHNQLTDVLCYNHYFGWYGGNVSQNGPWLDEFHQKYPHRCVGMSEYGAEAVMGWHSSAPMVRDYTEEYQAYYHEQMLETFSTRPYLWATYEWNMFDFAADARDEGGSQGRNNKGMVTYDRKTRKDAFYAYKAWWSKEPFVYVAGRRFLDRAPGQRDIKVYSNQSEVTLLVNGKPVAAQSGEHVFVFHDVALADGLNTVTAVAGELSDTITLNAVAKANPDYVLPGFDPNAQGVTNWFADLQVEGQMEYPEGYFSLRDTIGDIYSNPEAAALLSKHAQAIFGPMAKSMENMYSTGMMSKTPLQDVLKMSGPGLDEKGKLYLNQQFNQIKK
ncbi:glycoside hydrolase family 2 TIM barrel-domain containing protein [Flavonifractor sp. An100]|uniref:glycoside hydrolase family 2 protein n=1 Tax=Flavonifractor sp. An100 TaxID=1965538 RepID=UPI000B39B483|nr:glycoside hydrolase family 2 TIM barrel-domain containing protein [Flavonifractor sp. An100]OUQ75227.1 hypothetical protein B5E43_14005 [Flavonifractor sp. An100]